MSLHTALFSPISFSEYLIWESFHYFIQKYYNTPFTLWLPLVGITVNRNELKVTLNNALTHCTIYEYKDDLTGSHGVLLLDIAPASRTFSSYFKPDRVFLRACPFFWNTLLTTPCLWKSRKEARWQTDDSWSHGISRELWASWLCSGRFFLPVWGSWSSWFLFNRCGWQEHIPKHVWTWISDCIETAPMIWGTARAVCRTSPVYTHQRGRLRRCLFPLLSRARLSLSWWCCFTGCAVFIALALDFAVAVVCKRSPVSKASGFLFIININAFVFANCVSLQSARIVEMSLLCICHLFVFPLAPKFSNWDVPDWMSLTLLTKRKNQGL